MNQNSIKTAIIPIAGLGTRMLPFTKVIPKAMLPVHNRPCVQWLVEELEEAGITEIIFVYSKGQEIVKDYFTHKTWYDEELEARGKHKEAQHLEEIRNLATFHFVLQEEPHGDGHAILQAKNLVKDEPCLVVFGDCLYTGDEVIPKMLKAYEDTQSCIIATQEIRPEQVDQYGIILPESDDDVFTIKEMIEKPALTDPRLEGVDSPLAIIGRYILDPNIWQLLEEQHSDSGEIRLIDSLKKEDQVYGLRLKGTWLDTGSLEGLWEASIMLKDEN